MNYRLVTNNSSSLRVISPLLSKRDAINCAHLLKRFGLCAFVYPAKKAAGLPHDLENTKLANECRDMLRSTREFSAEDVQAILDECR